MALQNAAPLVFEFDRAFPRPHCPRCGEFLVAPERSEFVHPGRIQHAWACDSCGAQFATAVDFNLAAK
jgi:uncharacterized protein with PIN domain